MFILRMISSTKSIAKNVIWGLRIFPSFSFGYGLICIANSDLYAIIDGYYEPKSPYSTDLAGGDILFLFFTAIIYFLLILLVEKMQTLQSV